ncbi:MAG: HAMP domain-containing sensor histidine kinase [Oscillospiraceae bacterium]|nr:HAMP domain-containing sensor histidine kinase [Oscillospiraceae bacterium]
MKNYIRFFVILAIAVTAFILLALKVSGSYKSQETNILQLNDIVQTIKEKWNDPESLESSRLGTQLLIFNSNDQIIYSASDGELKDIKSPLEAIDKGCKCMTIADGGKYLGCVVIPDSEKSESKLIKQRLIIISAAMIVILLVSVIVIGLYVNSRIIKPFRRMKKFAGNIAEGRLDEPLMMEKNNMFGIFTESFDIMREELRESRRRETDLKLKEKELVASLSHDLKTPVTGIKLICELLTVKTEDSYVKQKIDNINQKAEQINVLVSDLLSSALDDLGEMNVSCQDETSDILHELVAEHDSRSLITDESVPACIICVDRIRLSQVIGNIINNSYKYADTRIDIIYRINGSYLEMSIRDYGDGVAEEEINMITNKFYRGRTNTTGKDGSGLGLYISSELMAKMNGELICSCKDKGLTVTLMIPLS